MYLQETDSKEKIGLLKNENGELETKAKQREICSTPAFCFGFYRSKGR